MVVVVVVVVVVWHVDYESSGNPLQSASRRCCHDRRRIELHSQTIEDWRCEKLFASDLAFCHIL
jgi:hypothetical protein